MANEADESDPRTREVASRVARLVDVALHLSDTTTSGSLADSEHARMVEALREVYQLIVSVSVSSVRRGGEVVNVMPTRSAVSLVTIALRLYRMAPTMHRVRNEVVGTAALAFVALHAVASVAPQSSRSLDAVERSDRWLEATWCGMLDANRATDDGDADAADRCHDFGTATNEHHRMDGQRLKDLAFGYLTCATLATRRSVLPRLAPAQIARLSTAEVLIDETTRTIVEAADAELGQQVRLSPPT